MARRVLLVAPPVKFRMASGHLGGAGFDLGATFPPLGLMILATILNRNGHEAHVLDFAEEPYSPQRLLEAVKGKELVGFSVLRTNRDAVQQLVDTIHHHNPGLPIICGGPDVSLRPTVFAGSVATVIGEAEETIERVVETVCSGGDLSQCSGVQFRDDRTGEDRLGPPSALPGNLDGIPFPDRTLVDRSRYGLFGPRSRGRTAMVITTRGCPFNCSFCSRLAQNRNTYRMRSAQNVLRELEALHEDGYRYIFFGDANFVVDRTRTEAILSGIIERRFRFRIVFGCRADVVDEALLKLMRRAGVFLVSYGFESGSQRMLDFLNKRTTVEQNRRALALTHKTGILCHGNFIIGGKDETMEDIRETMSFSRSPGMDAAFFNLLAYQYGSRLWRDAHAEGLVADHELNKLSTLENGLSPHSEKDLRRWHHEALLRFYLRPTYLSRLFARSVRMGDLGLFRLVANSICSFLSGYLKRELFQRGGYAG